MERKTALGKLKTCEEKVKELRAIIEKLEKPKKVRKKK
jgi:hypothetical protein